MKIIGIIGVAAAVIFLSACNKSPQQQPTAIVDETPAPAPAPSAPTTPSPAIASAPPQAPVTPAAVQAPAAATAVELAPPGVFYMTEAVRIETDAGVTGLTPGTGVKLLHDDVYLTPAGEAHLRPEQMTNDMALARRILTADREAQASLKTTMAAKAKAVSDLNAAQSAQATANHSAALASQDATAKQARVTQLSIQRDALSRQLIALQAKQSQENYRKNFKGHIVASSTADDSKGIIAQIAAIDQELARLQ